MCFYFHVLVKICKFTPDFRGSNVNVCSWTCPALHNKRQSTPSQVRQCCCNKAGIGWEMRESLHFVERRLLNAHRYNPNFEHLESSVADDAMVDVPGMCLYASPLDMWTHYCVCVFAEGVLYTYSAWASKLLIFTEEASSKAGIVR